MTPSDTSYREIPLTRGQVAKVSPHRYDELMRWKWHAQWMKVPQAFYAYRSYLTADGKPRSIAMHRQILGLEYGDRRQGDHINMDSLDNTDENLRIATCAEQMRNRAKKTRSKTGFKGVSFHKKTGKYQASIGLNYKSFHIGLFDTPEEAYAARCRRLEEFHGQFARS